MLPPLCDEFAASLQHQIAKSKSVIARYAEMLVADPLDATRRVHDLIQAAADLHVAEDLCHRLHRCDDLGQLAQYADQQSMLVLTSTRGDVSFNERERFVALAAAWAVVGQEARAWALAEANEPRVRRDAMILPHEYNVVEDDPAAYAADSSARQAVTVAYAFDRLAHATIWVFSEDRAAMVDDPWIVLSDIRFVSEDNNFVVTFGRTGKRAVNGRYRVFAARSDLPVGTVGPRGSSHWQRQDKLRRVG
jgi:hypothetical protein